MIEQQFKWDIYGELQEYVESLYCLAMQMNLDTTDKAEASKLLVEREQNNALNDFYQIYTRLGWPN